MAERCVIATPIFYIRWWLARNGFASHALSCRLHTGCACELEGVERSTTHERDDSRCALDGSGNPANRRLVDSHRGNFHSID